MKEVKFGYGIFNKLLKDQANEQGFELKDEEKFEKIRKAINMCKFHVATESQIDAMFKKLNKQVIENLVPLEKFKKERKVI